MDYVQFDQNHRLTGLSQSSFRAVLVFGQDELELRDYCRASRVYCRPPQLVVVGIYQKRLNILCNPFSRLVEVFKTLGSCRHRHGSSRGDNNGRLNSFLG